MLTAPQRIHGDLERHPSLAFRTTDDIDSLLDKLPIPARLTNDWCPLEAAVDAATLERRQRVCAVKRRRFPAGVSPARQPLQPEPTGAVTEVLAAV